MDDAKPLVVIEQRIAPEETVGALKQGILCLPAGGIKAGQLRVPSADVLSEELRRQSVWLSRQSLSGDLTALNVSLCTSWKGILSTKPRGKLSLEISWSLTNDGDGQKCVAKGEASIRDSDPRISDRAIIDAIAASLTRATSCLEERERFLAALLATLDSIFSFSREMETEADMESLVYLQKSPYSTDSAYKIWEHLRAEQDATALARKQKSRKDKNGGFFATHPNSGERMAYLKARSEAVVNPDGSTHSDSFRAAMQAWWPKLVDDQVKLNDFGGTEYLLDAIAAGQWTPDLLYARGELYRSRGQGGDMDAAAGFYRQAIEGGSQLPEAWRGLGLAEIRAGRNDEGRAALREYLARKPEAGDKGIISMMIGG